MTMRQSMSPDDDSMMIVSIETNGITDAMWACERVVFRGVRAENINDDLICDSMTM